MTTLYGMEFNYSYFVTTIIVAAIVIAVIGVLQYKIHGNKVRRRYNDNMFKIAFSIFLMVSTITLLAGGAVDGLVCFIDENYLAAGDDSAWSVILSMATVMIFGAITGLILICLGKGTSLLSKRALIKLHH